VSGAKNGALHSDKHQPNSQNKPQKSRPRRPSDRLRTVHETSAGGLVIDGIDGPKETQVAALIGRIDRRGRMLWSLPKGHIELAGQRIDRLQPYEVVRRGVVQVFEGRRVFEHLTTEENLRLGAYVRRDRNNVESDLERVYGYFPRLRERRRQQAGTLSGGEQQMLAVSRALMLRPRLMLLDEPSFGLAPLVVRELFAILATINQREQVSLLLVEQNAAMALELASHAYLLETGRVVLGGAADELRRDDAVRRAYLGY